MKIICTQENLKIGIQQVIRIVSSSTTLPILNNLLLETNSGQLKISATNLEIGMSVLVRCKIEIEGSVCISAKILQDLISNLPNDNIIISASGDDVLISTEGYQTKVKSLSSEDFPLIPQIEDSKTISVNSLKLKELFDSVSYAVSNSETQPEISGILLKLSENKLTATATDRYRLSENKIDVNFNNDFSIIIPHKSVSEISKTLAGTDSEIDLMISNTQIAFHLGAIYLVSRLIDGQYPEYNQIIPTEQGTKIEVEQKKILSALKTSGIFSRGMGSVTLKYSDDSQTLQIHSSSQGVGESQIEIPVKVDKGSGEVVINYRYILDFLNNSESDELSINIINDSSPVVFRQFNNKNFLYLIMPIRS